ncbi:Hairy/enhancer-of-split with YRPW motif protein 2 [Exophiala xenobiotica]|nr:Hairy/enhancer-of-split with YRPW motif protein 2 [Exophiala xenobiotica]
MSLEVQPVWTSEPGSMANETALTRWPRIVLDIVKDVTETCDQLSSQDEKKEAQRICRELESLHEEITTDGKLRKLTPPVSYQKMKGSPMSKIGTLSYGKSKVALGWRRHGCSRSVICTTRRRVQAIFVISDTQIWPSYDYFKRQKDSTFAKSSAAVEELAARFINMVKEKDAFTDQTHADAQRLLFTEMVEIALWGNATDLSMLGPLSVEDLQSLQGRDSIAKSRRNIVDDDLDDVWRFLSRHPRANIDIVLDNAGFEFFTDMLLATYLLEMKIASSIRIHVKDFPWFVSDVIPSDIPSLFSHLKSTEIFPHHRQEIDQLVTRMQNQLSSGAIHVQQHPFWTTGHTYHDMPSHAKDLFEDLKSRDLVITKGDLNYRKLTRDGLWPHTTRFEDAIGPMGRGSGINVMALRTNKADVVVGIETEAKVAELHKEAPNGAWTRNGRYAVISFNEGRLPN